MCGSNNKKHNKASRNLAIFVKPKAPEEKFSNTQPLSVKIQTQFFQSQKNRTPTFLC